MEANIVPSTFVEFRNQLVKYLEDAGVNQNYVNKVANVDDESYDCLDPLLTAYLSNLNEPWNEIGGDIHDALVLSGESVEDAKKIYSVLSKLV